ncbi:MAG TPA: nicotinate-nucleotide adenylyltransferase [Ignavibacteria bacterium]|nr:nicotinate-nucleotide adenylyltransferase [Ignavibacteria bacterium]
MKRYGILGGTFDPPHIAHSIIAEDVKEQLTLDKIIFIPSGNPPLKNSISSEHRLAMAKLAFADNEYFEISEVEIRNTDEKSYTVNTLTQMKSDPVYADSELFLIIGMDNLINLPKWKDPDKLFELAKIIVINRPDFDLKNVNEEYLKKAEFVDVPEMGISSSMIRKRIEQGKSVRYMVSEMVEDYIRRNELYKK